MVGGPDSPLFDWDVDYLRTALQHRLRTPLLGPRAWYSSTGGLGPGASLGPGEPRRVPWTYSVPFRIGFCLCLLHVRLSAVHVSSMVSSTKREGHHRRVKSRTRVEKHSFHWLTTRV